MKDMLQTIIVHSLVRQTMVMYISARVNKHVTRRGPTTLSATYLTDAFQSGTVENIRLYCKAKIFQSDWRLRSWSLKCTAHCACMNLVLSLIQVGATTNGFNFLMISSLVESMGVHLTWFDCNVTELTCCMSRYSLYLVQYISSITLAGQITVFQKIQVLYYILFMKWTQDNSPFQWLGQLLFIAGMC